MVDEEEGQATDSFSAREHVSACPVSPDFPDEDRPRDAW